MVIHGKPGCGKTLCATYLKARYQCRRVLDEWDGQTPLAPGDLALTHVAPPYQVDVDVVESFDDALEAEIDQAMIELQHAASSQARRRAWVRLQSLVKQRSARQVERMEREMGLQR